MGGMFRGGATSVNEPAAHSSTIDQFLISPPARWIAAAVLPPVCCFCGSAGTRPALDICEICRSTLPAAPPDQDYPPVFSRAVVPFRYAFPVDRCIKALKFGGERVYARVLGMLMAEARRGADGPMPQMLIPVPLHASRYRVRGFNQAQELARYAGRCLRISINTRCLSRTVSTTEQSGLPLAARQSNVRGAFAVRCPLPPTCHIALVDDVVTTGNTVAEAARALRAAGATNIELWAAAVAVKQSDDDAFRCEAQ
jgi:ComF family protein